jgi:hypothetical protein
MADAFNLSIKKFDIKTVPEHPVVVCIAKRSVAGSAVWPSNPLSSRVWTRRIMFTLVIQ